jgi:hypothetical protein
MSSSSAVRRRGRADRRACADGACSRRHRPGDGLPAALHARRDRRAHLVRVPRARRRCASADSRRSEREAGIGGTWWSNT